MKTFFYKQGELLFGYIENGKFFKLEELVTDCKIKGNRASILKEDSKFIEFAITESNEIIIKPITFD